MRIKFCFPALLALAACMPLKRHVPDALWSPELGTPMFAADSAGTDTLGRGLVHRWFARKSGPWVVHVLDVDRNACWAPVAVKAGSGALGRQKTSEIVRQLDSATTLVSKRSPALGGAI